MATFTSGTYILTQTIANPQADRRVKHKFWRTAEFKAGQKFVVDTCNHLRSDGAQSTIIFPQGSFEPIPIDSPDSDILALLLPALQPHQEIPSDRLARLHFSNLAEDVLDGLYAAGSITLEQVDNALAKVLED